MATISSCVGKLFDEYDTIKILLENFLNNLSAQTETYLLRLYYIPKRAQNHATFAHAVIFYYRQIVEIAPHHFHCIRKRYKR